MYKNEILNEREKTHGDYSSVATTSQDIRMTLEDGDRWDLISATQRESLSMFAVKMARIVNGDPNDPDHWLDIAGYANLIYEELMKQKNYVKNLNNHEISQNIEKINELTNDDDLNKIFAKMRERGIYVYQDGEINE